MIPLLVPSKSAKKIEACRDKDPIDYNFTASKV
jgi:hypothetical protein